MVEPKPFHQRRLEVEQLLDLTQEALKNELEGECYPPDVQKLASSVKALQLSLKSLMDDHVESLLAELEDAIEAQKRARADEDALEAYEDMMSDKARTQSLHGMGGH